MMISTVMQLTLVAGILVYFALLLYLLKKRNLSVKFSILWFVTGIVMLILAIFPSVLGKTAQLLGFEIASNALFSVLFFLTLLILLSLSSTVSKQNKQIKELAQKIALIEKELFDKTK